MAGLSEFLFGKKEQTQQMPTMSQEQQGLLQQLLGGMGGASGGGMEWLQKLLGGDTSAFEAPLMRQFQESTIPQLAERFSGMGAGAQSSSAFTQALGQAGAGLSENLGAMRGGLQMQGMGQLSNLLNIGLGQRPFENIMRPSTQGLFGGLSQGLGQAAGMLPFMFM